MRDYAKQTRSEDAEQMSVLLSGATSKPATFDKTSYLVYVEDLKSTNGTFVNKRKLNDGERCELQDGDVISLARSGAYDFVVKLA